MTLFPHFFYIDTAVVLAIIRSDIIVVGVTIGDNRVHPTQCLSDNCRLHRYSAARAAHCGRSRPVKVRITIVGRKDDGFCVIIACLGAIDIDAIDTAPKTYRKTAAAKHHKRFICGG